MRKEFFSTHVEPEILARLRRLSAVTFIPMAFYVRQGLEMVLRKHEAKRAKR